MQAKDPSENVLTTRQVTELIEELVGKRPTSDQIREWCRQGYVAPDELPPIHLEHVRNRQGHYEITEESVRRFVEMRRRRETNLLAFVKWCRQRSAELQTKSNNESAAAPPEPTETSDDEPAPGSTEDSIEADSAFADDLNESDARPGSPSPMQAFALDPDASQSPEFNSETTTESIALPIMADAADAFAGDLLSELVVEEAGEDLEDDFFSTFIEDDQSDADSNELDSVDDNDDDAARESSDVGVLSAVSDAAIGESAETELPESDPPQPELTEPKPPTAESLKPALSQDEPAEVPVDDFGSFDEPPGQREREKRGRRGFRSRRARFSRSPLQCLRESSTESHDLTRGDQMLGDQVEDDAFSFGIFESADEIQEPAYAIEDVAEQKSADSAADLIDSEPSADDNIDTHVTDEVQPPAAAESPVDEPDADDPPIAQPGPVAEPIAAILEPAPQPTPTHPVAPTLSLPPIKPLPANSPLLPNFGAPRVSSPLRPESQNQKPIAKPTQDQSTKTHPHRRSNAPSARRANTMQSAQLDQLAAAYAAFASGAAPAVAEPPVEPEPRKPVVAPATPEARRDNDQKTQSLDRAVDDHAITADAVTSEVRNSKAPSLESDNEPETLSSRDARPDRPRTAAQVSRYLWLWVTAIAIGWACFGVSFVIKDDFGVIALSSIAVAATGMSGLWWTGK